MEKDGKNHSVANPPTSLKREKNTAPLGDVMDV